MYAKMLHHYLSNKKYLFKNLFVLTLIITILTNLIFNVSAEKETAFLIKDDFSDIKLTRWTKESLGRGSNISVIDGELCLETTMSDDNPRIYPTFPSSIEYNFVSVEFDLRLEGSKNSSRQFALRDSAENWFYILCSTKENKIAIGQRSPVNTNIVLENSVTYRVRYELYDAQGSPYVSVYIDNEYIGDVVAPNTWNKELKKMYFLMHSNADETSSTHIDNFIVNVTPDDFYYNSDENLHVEGLSLDKDGKNAYYITDGNMEVNVTLHSDRDTTASLIVAQYKREGKYLSLHDIDVSSKNVKKDESVSLSVPIEVENSQNTVVKVMLLENFKTLKPLIPVTCIFPRWNSMEISHPNNINNYSYTTMLGYQERDRILSEDEDYLLESLENVLDLDEADFISYIDSITSGRLYIDQPYSSAELICQRLASLYQITKNEKYARYSLLTMYLAAKNYEHSSRLLHDKFFAYMNIIPKKMVYAYDIIYNSDNFNSLSQEYGEDVRMCIEDYFFSTVMDMYNALNGRYYTNVTLYGIRDAFLVAITLNHSDLIRLFIPWIDTLISNNHFYADGMWEEGTTGYNDQVSVGIINLINSLNNCFNDSDNYSDVLLGITLPDEHLINRWPLLEKSSNVSEILKYPDASPVCINDTSFDEPFSKNTQAPIDEKYLENVEMTNFKHYSLTGGDISNASSVHLNFEAQSLNNSHHHTAFLSMTLWSAGAELLPDAGYPRVSGTPENYFFKSPLAHNVTWVWDKDTNYYINNRNFESALLAYDDGEKNEKQIQLIEASQRGQNYDFVDMKRRVLLMVKTNENHFYIVDVNRLRGGDAHELYLRSSEDEDVSLSCQIPLNQNSGTLEDYLKTIQKEEGLSGLNELVNLRSLCLNPQTTHGEDAFSFSWKGDRTNSSLNVFLNDVHDSEIFFSEIPSLRRTLNDKNLYGEYHASQLYRRRIVSDNSVTKYGAVYEGVKENEIPIVTNVEWSYPDDSENMCIAIKITTEDFYDIIYLSDDYEKRDAFGVSFSGKYGAIRINKSGCVNWGYIYSDGNISYDDYSLSGQKDISFKINKTENNEIIYNAHLTDVRENVGNYIICIAEDSFGYGYKILDAYTESGETHIIPNETLAFSIDNDNVILKYHDGLIIKDAAYRGKLYYNMFYRKQFDSMCAFIKSSVFKKEE